MNLNRSGSEVGPIALATEENRKVESGLEFILSHFCDPKWPRTVSTAATQGKQCRVDYKDRALLYCESSPLRQDCRINPFGTNQRNPDLLFLDLDLKDFATSRALKAALTRTLKKMAECLNGAHPTVIWSGNGFHIIQPIKCDIALEEITVVQIGT